MSTPSDKQIKKWNKDIDEAIDLIRKIKELTLSLSREADRLARGGKPGSVINNKKIEKLKREFRTVNTRVILIPKEARPLTNYSKFEKIFFSN